MGDIGLFAAFAAGFLSFVSPCTLALVPIFLAYLTGISTSQGDGMENKNPPADPVFQHRQFCAGVHRCVCPAGSLGGSRFIGA